MRPHELLFTNESSNLNRTNIFRIHMGRDDLFSHEIEVCIYFHKPATATGRRRCVYRTSTHGDDYSFWQAETGRATGQRRFGRARVLRRVWYAPARRIHAVEMPRRPGYDARVSVVRGATATRRSADDGCCQKHGSRSRGGSRPRRSRRRKCFGPAVEDNNDCLF